MKVIQRSHAVLDHHQNFIKSTLDGETGRHDGIGGHLAELVFGKAREIFDEFGKIFSNFEWALECVALDACAPEEDGLGRELITLQVELTGHHAAAYFRRIVAPCCRRSNAERHTPH